MDNIFPYEKILPKELYKDLLKTFINLLDPNIKPIDKRTVDSKIITYQHVELISKWINRLEITDKLNSPYEFKLLFRGSCDGLGYSEFHKICDNQSRTVTIVKVKNSSEILGGYTKDSFIFFFNDIIF